MLNHQNFEKLRFLWVFPFFKHKTHQPNSENKLGPFAIRLVGIFHPLEPV
jgi:hypothetical protein